MTEWELTSDTLGIMTAACRPAGFMNYVLHTSLLNARINNSKAGLCAQGVSAGSGALGYSLAWYEDQDGNYLNTDLDNVELISGPVFSNIELGCQVPGPPVLASICPTGQFGCSSGTTQWTSILEYIDGYAQGVRNWTNDQSCNNGTTTTQKSNQQWLAMSIVNGSGGTFTYPNLGMAGWLCATSQVNNHGSCGPACPNNSAGQGQQFYNQFTSSSQAAGYKLTGIIGCMGAEDVSNGDDPDNCPGPNCQTGKQAFEAHMTKQCVHPTPH
jgi:hypothetical protein